MPKAAPHDLTERPVFGAPRTLPVVLLCHATVEWCGNLQIANTPEEYREALEKRRVHEAFCENMPETIRRNPLFKG